MNLIHHTTPQYKPMDIFYKDDKLTDRFAVANLDLIGMVKSQVNAIQIQIIFEYQIMVFSMPCGLVCNLKSALMIFKY